MEKNIEALRRQLVKEIAKREKMQEALEYYENGIDHFYGCIDFGASPLDAEAIDYMNTVGVKIQEAQL